MLSALAKAVQRRTEIAEQNSTRVQQPEGEARE